MTEAIHVNDVRADLAVCREIAASLRVAGAENDAFAIESLCEELAQRRLALQESVKHQERLRKSNKIFRARVRSDVKKMKAKIEGAIALGRMHQP